MSDQAVPEGYHTVTSALSVHDATSALEFYMQAFSATELSRMTMNDGKIGHAEIQVGDSRVMLGDEWPGIGVSSPKSLGGTSVSLHLYVQDCDAIFDQAVRAGATIERAVEDQFYGDRSGTVIDPFGHRWMISTRKEDLTEDEIARRFEEWQKSMEES